MNLTAADQTLQLISWFLALIELTLALYILVLNTRHTANRHVSGLLLLFAASNFALGLMMGTTNAAQIALPIHAATAPAIQPALLLVAVVLLKPQWLRGRWRQIWWVVYGLSFLPILLTLMDIGLGTRLWYTGPDAETYTGGFVPLAEITAGSLSQLIRALNIYVMGVAPFIPALYVVLRDKEVTPLTRRLAWLLLGAQLVAIVLQIGLHRLLVGGAPLLLTGTIFVLAYAYAGFKQLILERRRQRGKLRTRLTALILVVTIPLLVAVAAFVSTRAAALIEQNATEQLGAINRALASNVSMWLDLNVKALQELVFLPDITSMDPERQKPLLEAMAEAYPHMYLVSTTDLTGFNVARSDRLAFQDYGDHLWQIAARNGVPLTFEVMIGKATGLPSLVASVPIRGESGNITGVGMFASTLSGITQEMRASKVGETGFAYVVDTLNRVVAHPDRALFAEVQEFDDYPPVSALRRGTRGAIAFTDDQGRRWRAYVDELDNGWGVIVQQQEAEWLIPLQLFQRVSWTAAAIGTIVLLLLAGLTVRQALLPIGTLTATASAIAAGDLTRVAQVESEDEIGILARVFNSMTAQLRDLIGSLEQRVADQTRDLEHRAVQLEAAAQVAREAAEIRDVGRLLDVTVRLISERFGFYHAGIFLLDERGEYAVLQAASSEGGQRMLARRHQLKVGEVGIVGYAAGTGEARIALDVGADAVFFNNPDLPNTRSEMAVPLKIRERVIGVLDVQSTQEATFSGEDVAIIQTMADQVALAIENARLLEESQRALRELETLYGQRAREAWRERTSRQPAAYRYTGVGVEAAPLSLALGMTALPSQRSPVVVQGEDGRHLTASIRLRGQTLGSIILRQGPEKEPWSDEEIALVEEVSTQIGLGLENARLLEETKQRATHLAAAAEVARDATAILDVDQLLDETVHLISEQFGFYHAGVFLLDEQDGYAVLRAASSEGGKRMLKRGHRLKVGKVGIVGHVAGTGEPRISLDVGKDATHFAHSDLPETQSEMALPLKVRDRVIGVLDVQSTREAAFSEDDMAVLQTLADQLAAAIANARLFQEVRADAMRRDLINKVQQAAVASLDPDEMLHQAGEVISQRLQRPSAIFVWEPEKQALRPVAVHDAGGNDVPLADGLRVTREMNPTLFSKVVEGRRISALNTLAPYPSHPATTLAEQMGLRSGIYVPLTARDQMLGVLALAQPERRLPEELDFIEIVGANLSVALENARLYQEAVKTTERLKEMDRLKSQFLANMSHELRTPLNSIIGFSRVILKGIDGPLTDVQRTDLQAVYDSGQHLLGLINDILDISKIQAGKMELSFEETDLREIIKGVMSTAIALVKDKPVELRQSAPPDLAPVCVDSRRIRQVLLNLVGNAAKFTEEGFISVEVEAHPTELIISVSDSGIGIPPDKLDTIFEEFTQVDGSSTRRTGGTGLGLSISRHFVELHGGRIWVESAPDAGTSFYIALPIESPPEPSEEKEEAEAEQLEPEQESNDRRLVLCVDDDEGVIMLFRRYLNKQGYRVVGLTDGALVIEKARQLNPFAITLDVMMPDKDGWQVIQELKAHPDTRDIPVIMCSIVSEKEYGLSLGASDYLLKPILEEDLLAALERLDRGESPRRVLVVDDQQEDRDLLRRMIESQNRYEVVEAAGGQEAITLVQQIRPSIIILDLMMPDVDGFAVLESVKADRVTRSIPIIVVTAKDLTEEERDTLNRQVEKLLQKGLFGQQELLADVAAALERIKTDGTTKSEQINETG